MNRPLVERIAQALLYEGYILYPYRPSVKNRQRWTFGGLYPRSYCAVRGNTETWSMQTQCLVAGDGQAVIHGIVRFLHLMSRRVAEVVDFAGGQPEYRFVESLSVGDRKIQAWQEAVERDVAFGDVAVSDLAARPRRRYFTFSSRRDLEELRDQAGRNVGAIIREQQEIAGVIELTAAPAGERLYQLTVRIENGTRWEPCSEPNRDEALLYSLVSTHTILGVRGGEFISMLDPPAAWREAAARCRNIGTWPVLVGAEGECDTMLSSPIILYDYPQVAPESPGDLFDGTEIDEILTLRILSLTEDEKQAMAAVDERARALLERTEALSAKQLRKLHGTMRPVRP